MLKNINTMYLQGNEVIPSKHVGYVLRILGQNPTEDEIVAMVMKVSQQLQPFNLNFRPDSFKLQLKGEQ